MHPNQKRNRLNTEEAAEYLGLRPGTLEVWRSLGKGPRYVKLGTRVLYDADDLDTFADSRIVETTDTISRRKRGSHV